MCMQCVAEGATYVGGAVGALQILKVRARAARLRPAPRSTRGAEVDESEPQPADR